MWATLDLGYWLCLLLAVPAAGFLVRLFMIQHDCGHGAFFHRRRHQRLGGSRDRGADADAIRFLAAHPCRSPLDIRQSRSPRDRRHRHADRAGVSRAFAVRVGCVTASTGTPSSCSASARPICSSCSTGCRSASCATAGSPGSAPWRPMLAIAAIVAAMIWLIGVGPFLLVHLPIMLLAASVGVWLFYVQHQFENTVWAHDEAWNLQEVALHGSSHYDLPRPPALVHRQYRRPSRSSSVQPDPLLPAARSCCATIRTSRASAGSPCCRASGACDWCCGTRTSSVSSPSATCVGMSDPCERRRERLQRIAGGLK